MIARLMLWDSIGASRVPLDVFSFGLAPASPPGLSFTLCALAGTEPAAKPRSRVRAPNQGDKCGVSRSVTTRPNVGHTLLEVPNDAGLGLRWRAPHPRPFYDTQRPPGIQSRAACAMNCRLSGSVHQLCEE